VALDEPADMRDEPYGLVVERDEAMRLDGDVVPGRDDLAGEPLFLIPSG
jgi:hypothetical protein